MVLTGYKTVKEAFIGYADEFGERQAPLVVEETNLNRGTEGSQFQKQRFTSRADI